jgi:hypothetical protein
MFAAVCDVGLEGIERTASIYRPGAFEGVDQGKEKAARRRSARLMGQSKEQKNAPPQRGARRSLLADFQIARRFFAPVGNNFIFDDSAFIEIA